MAEIQFHPAAAAEFEEALCWYAERNTAAAEGLDEAVTQALHDISQAPAHWPLIDKRHRRLILTKRFPYHIVYRVDGEIVTVIAIAHHRRRPGYWLRSR